MRLKVTARDVEDAILIGEILGGYDEAFPDGDSISDLRCLKNFFQRHAEHCSTCTCKSEDYDECDHELDCTWECVASAIGASPEAEWLWMHVSNIVSDLHPDTPERDKFEEPIKTWLASLVDATRRCNRRKLNNDLEAAALLREGLLPPDIVLVSRKRKTPAPKRGTSRSVR